MTPLVDRLRIQVERLSKLHLLFVVAATILFAGCGKREQPPPTLGVTNWKPSGIGGPVETRPLPPANRVVSDYQAWQSEDTGKKGRVYEATLHGVNQSQFLVRTNGGDTPMGYVETTEASFHYKDPTNGEYEIFWSRRGGHNLNFLNLNSSSKLVWLQPNGLTNANGNPQLKIVAFEGLEPDWGIFAESGGNTN